MDNESILRPKITVPQLALAKGWINGLDLVALALRYLPALGYDDGKIDLRVAKTALSNVLQELANAATRNGIEGGQTLMRQAKRIRTDPSGPTGTDLPARPSFEEFVASLEHGDEFSHDELVEAYKDRHPPADTAYEKAIARQSRLTTRQLQLLSRLESLVSAPIKWHDPVAGWFAQSLAQRLDAGGFKTIERLAVAIAANPSTWHASVPGVGVSKASRIERYLRSQLGNIEDELSKKGIAYEVVESINHDLERINQINLEEPNVARTLDSTTVPPSPPLLGMEHLNVSVGRLRDRHNASATDAKNDYEAMKTWLKLRNSAVTAKLYEREIMRLISWSVNVRGRAMSSLSIEDAIAYRDFLNAIPKSIVIKKGPRARSSQAQSAVDDGSVLSVASFTKVDLKKSTIKKALVIIRSFFSWLMATRYVTANPFVGVQPTAELQGIGMRSTDAGDEKGIELDRERRASVLDRVLPWDVTDAVNRYLDKSPERKDALFHARARFVFKFATMTGLRISEMAAARRDHLKYIETDPISGTEGGWILHVVGKRNKHREVPMPDELIAELATYLAHRGLVTLPCPALSVEKGTFLIGGLPSHIPTGEKAAAAEIAAEERKKSKPNSAIKKPKKPDDGVRPQTIHRVLKELFETSLRSHQFKDEDTAKRVRLASAHWLRHTLATRAVASGTPVDVVSGILGHASIATTSIYIQAERDRKISEMRKLWSSPKGRSPNPDSA